MREGSAAGSVFVSLETNVTDLLLPGAVDVDVDCGDAAGMVLESAASAQLGAPAHAAAALIQRAYRASRARA